MHSGVGTSLEHAASPSVRCRKAVLADVAEIGRIINAYAACGLMLPRTHFELCGHIRDFIVAEIDGGLVGCVALCFYSECLGELRSLAVRQEYRRFGIGRHLVSAVDAEARAFHLDTICLFTYVPEFFAKAGYVAVPRDSLPLKALKDCATCPKRTHCDETAMIKSLHGGGAHGRGSILHVL